MIRSASQTEVTRCAMMIVVVSLRCARSASRICCPLRCPLRRCCHPESEFSDSSAGRAQCTAAAFARLIRSRRPDRDWFHIHPGRPSQIHALAPPCRPRSAPHPLPPDCPKAGFPGSYRRRAHFLQHHGDCAAQVIQRIIFHIVPAHEHLSSSASYSRGIIWTRVDFALPVPPMTPMVSPERIERLISESTGFSAS